MRKSLHILLLALLVGLGFTSCKPKLIERDDMVKIMHDVILQDQYLKLQVRHDRRWDTLLVYEGIFQKYGYTTDNFVSSLPYYFEDPARMEKVMGEVVKLFEKESAVLEKELRQEEWRKKMLRIYHQPMSRRLPEFKEWKGPYGLDEYGNYDKTPKRTIPLYP